MLDEKTKKPLSPAPKTSGEQIRDFFKIKNKEKTVKLLRIISIAAFLLPLFALGIYSMLDTDLLVSEVENRTLARRPEFSVSALMNRTYTGDLDEYYTDTFPGRETLMLAGREIRGWFYIPLENSSTIVGGEFNMGDGEALPPEDYSYKPAPKPSPDTGSSIKPSPSISPGPEPTPEASPSPEQTPEPTPEPEVDLNEGGYLITGNRIMHLSYTNAASCRAYADMLNRLQETMPERRVISLIAPNSFPFYAPGSQISSSLDQNAMIESLYAMYDERIIGVNPYERLMEHKEEYLYFRTDHHWNGRGAYWAYTALCDALGYTPTDIEALRKVTYENFIGSFYREVASYPAAKAVKDEPDTVEAFVPDVEYTAYAYKTAEMTDGWSIPMVNEALSEKNTNKYVCFTNGDQPVIHVETGTKNGKSIAVVKESYGNAIIPWLLAHYEDIYVIDYRQFNQKDQPKLLLTDFVTDHNIGDILIVNYCYVPNTSIQYERMVKMFP